MKAILCVCVALVWTLPGLAQPDSVWSRTYGGFAYDFAQWVEPTTDGGYLLMGESDSYGAGSFDLWFLRVDSDGDSLWSRTYGGLGADHFRSCQPVEEGFVVAGSLDDQAWLLKLNASGDSLWSRTFGMPATAAQAIHSTGDGGLLLAGYVVAGETQTNLQLARLSATGELLWTHNYGGPNDETATDLEQTSDGGFIVSGLTNSFGAGSWNAWLLKVDADGDSLWSGTFGGDSLDLANGVLEAADGGIVMAGTTTSSGPGRENMWLLKLSATGDSLWSRMYGELEGWQGTTDLEPAADGGFLVAGYSSSPEQGIQYWLLRTNAAGDSLWSLEFGGGDWDQAYKIKPTADGGSILVGGTQSFGAGYVDVWLIKLGEELTAPKLPTRLPGEFALAAYPNPFNPATTIEYRVPRAGHVELAIYNTLGERVSTLVDDVQSAGEQAVIWDAAALPSGVYFVHARAGGEMRVMRLLLVK